jgi:hypothetical protein
MGRQTGSGASFAVRRRWGAVSVRGRSLSAGTRWVVLVGGGLLRLWVGVALGVVLLSGGIRKTPSSFRESRVNPGYPEKPRRCQDSGDVRVSRDSFRYRSIFSFSQRCVETVLKLPEVNLGSPHSVLGQGQSALGQGQSVPGQGQSALGLSQVEIRLSQANQSAL